MNPSSPTLDVLIQEHENIQIIFLLKLKTFDVVPILAGGKIPLSLPLFSLAAC